MWMATDLRQFFETLDDLRKVLSLERVLQKGSRSVASLENGIIRIVKRTGKWEGFGLILFLKFSRFHLLFRISICINVKNNWINAIHLYCDSFLHCFVYILILITIWCHIQFHHAHRDQNHVFLGSWLPVNIHAKVVPPTVFVPDSVHNVRNFNKV